MELNKKIVIDTKGGDKGAAAMIQGAVMALEKYPALELLLVGDAKEIEKTLAELNAPADRVEVLNAPGEITNYDNPAEAVFRKLDSSMIKALAALSRREDLYGLITSGNTGVLITACIRYLSGKERVRPTLAAVLPAANGGFVCLADAGATVDCTPQVLTHFARLGSKLMQDMYGIERPRVGLLSNGTESTKGNKLVKEAHALLAAEGGLNFVGNVEGNTALSGVCDVLVSDGFAGNLLLKVTEGTATRIITDAMKFAHKEGSEDVKRLVGHLMQVYDIGSLGGGMILGPCKPVIKTRGNAGPEAVVNTVGMMLNMAEKKAVFDAKKNQI